MLSQRLANIVFVIFILVACVYFAAVAQGFEAAGLLASSGLPSKFFPQLTLLFTGLCALVVGFLYAVRGEAGGDADQQVFNNSGETRRGLLMLLVTILCYFIWSRFGFIPMAILMGPLCLVVMGARSIWLYITVIALTALIYAVFTRFLGVQLT